MRLSDPSIRMPPFERELAWINTAALRADQQRGRPVLVEFWDFCRINSLRTLPYTRAWHERYEAAGLRVIGIHTGGFPCSRELGAIEAAVQRLGVPYPVVVDSELQMWDWYGNQGWPARYLWTSEQALFSVHYGEGAYAETEREIGELLGVEIDPVAPLRPEEAEGVLLEAQTADQMGAYCGPFEAAGVHLVCTGAGDVLVNGASLAVDGCGCYTALEFDRHTAGDLEIVAADGVEVLQTCFTAGLPV
jgi:hypothetical protein